MCPSNVKLTRQKGGNGAEISLDEFFARRSSLVTQRASLRTRLREGNKSECFLD